MSLETIAKMVSSDAIDIRPKYQRRERWGTDRQTALIESFLLNIPIPPVYLSEDDFGVYSVIDGKQRITAIASFLNDGLRLQGLETFKELDGFTFANLPGELKNALRVRPYLRVVTLLKQSDPQLKYEVFTRLNKGGEPLNSQEIRNVIFRGNLNDTVVKLAKNGFLCRQLKIKNEKSAAYQKMQDVEFVLRFLTFQNIWTNFSGDYRRSMDKFMSKNQDCSDSQIHKLSKLFLKSINGCEKIWGDAAFKRPQATGWRDQMLAGMYDAQMIAISELDEDTLSRAFRRRKQIVRSTREAFDDPKFEDAVRTATNTPAKLELRVNRIVDLLTRA
tara:strand:+ start:44272 stop:45267 length:996 start_codon:yes stop_codon:yes gene_type:complete